MIKYRKQITMSFKDDLPILKTDAGQTWYTGVPKGGINNLTSWWDSHRQDDLGQWQKDALIRGLANASNSKLALYNPYRLNNGYDQRPDIALAKIVNQNLWVLSTTEHTWMIKNAYNEIIFDVAQAIGPVTDPTVRDWIYQAECKIRGIPYRERIL